MKNDFWGDQARAIQLPLVSKTDEFCIKNDEFCIQGNEFLIKIQTTTVAATLAWCV